jgi:hypothetical protein
MVKNTYLTILFIVCSVHAYADELSGTWKFEKAKEYSGSASDIPAPKNTVIQIINNKLAISSTCFTDLKKEKYYFPEVFQSLMKEGGEEKALGQFIDKNFSFIFSPNSYFEISDVKKNVWHLFQEFFCLKTDL